jgi:hypothetical protein
MGLKNVDGFERKRSWSVLRNCFFLSICVEGLVKTKNLSRDKPIYRSIIKAEYEPRFLAAAMNCYMTTLQRHVLTVRVGGWGSALLLGSPRYGSDVATCSCVNCVDTEASTHCTPVVRRTGRCVGYSCAVCHYSQLFIQRVEFVGDVLACGNKHVSSRCVHTCRLT